MKLFYIVLFCLLISCEDNGVGTAKTYGVKYKVSGTAQTVNITYATSINGTAQESNCTPPWTYSFKGYKGDFIYLSAQNQHASGSVTVEIYINTALENSITSSGAYVIASLSGTL